jgi:serine/threonine protein kinase
VRLIEVYKNINEINFSSVKIEDVLKKWRGQLREYGIIIRMQLGAGTNGIAYEVAGDKVFKVTVDKDEAQASQHLIGKKLKNVCEFYKVFQFDAMGYYGILEERLDKVPSFGPTSFFKDLLDYDQIQQTVVAYSEGEITDQDLYNEFIAALEEIGTRKFAVDEYWSVAKKGLIDVANGLKELKQNGIKYHDVYSDNIMRRDNRDFVIIDLGYSKSAVANIEEI